MMPQRRRALLWVGMVLTLGGLAVSPGVMSPAGFAPMVPAPQPVLAQDPCDGLIPARLAIGQAARITSTYGVSLKDEPWPGAAGSTEVALMPYGTVATVLDGFRCNYGYRWWQIQLPDGTTGWAAEGSESDRFMEPFTMGVHLARPRGDGTQLAHYFITSDGRAGQVGTYDVPQQTATPRDTWQQVEIDWLDSAFQQVQADCPDRLAADPPPGVVGAAGPDYDAPLPPAAYDVYLSPDGTQVVLVQHLHLLMPRCDNVVPERVGISTVSVVGEDGTLLPLFPFPQHGSVPPSTDSYFASEPPAWNVYLDEVVWSPNGRYIAFVAAYREESYRFHVFVFNLRTGQLYMLGEGRHVGWTSGGERLNVFRLITGDDGRGHPYLFSTAVDGSDRQEIWLPGGAEYLSPEQEALGFPWNDAGTRVMVANAGYGEVMLFNVNDRAFTPPVVLPDLAPRANRLAVSLMRGDTVFLWTTIRGRFVTQDVQSGRWDELTSELASTGIAPAEVRAFADGRHALIEMADGSAYVLDIETDILASVVFPE